MKINPRTESEVFSQLAKLCASPGYIHAIAFFCFRDNTIGFANEMVDKDILKQYSPEHLIRTEISTLIGLACKDKFDIQLPNPKITQKYIDETESLLNELHQSMMQPTIDKILNSSKNACSNPFCSLYRNGAALPRQSKRKQCRSR